jgi:hypothetical protein
MAVLHEHEIHYRCNFELIPSKPTERAWGELVRLVRSWISGRIVPERLNPVFGGKWFFVGGEWRAPKLSRLFARTDRCVGAGNELVPQCWALRFEHPDAENVAFYFQRLRRHSFVRILERINSNPVYG